MDSLLRIALDKHSLVIMLVIVLIASQAEVIRYYLRQLTHVLLWCLVPLRIVIICLRDWNIVLNIILSQVLPLVNHLIMLDDIVAVAAALYFILIALVLIVEIGTILESVHHFELCVTILGIVDIIIACIISDSFILLVDFFNVYLQVFDAHVWRQYELVNGIIEHVIQDIPNSFAVRMLRRWASATSQSSGCTHASIFRVGSPPIAISISVVDGWLLLDDVSHWRDFVVRDIWALLRAQQSREVGVSIMDVASRYTWWESSIIIAAWVGEVVILRRSLNNCLGLSQSFFWVASEAEHLIEHCSE
jgi:hypothetical protein